MRRQRDMGRTETELDLRILSKFPRKKGLIVTISTTLDLFFHIINMDASVCIID